MQKWAIKGQRRRSDWVKMDGPGDKSGRHKRRKLQGQKELKSTVNEKMPCNAKVDDPYEPNCTVIILDCEFSIKVLK